MDCSMPGFPILHLLAAACLSACSLSQWCSSSHPSHPLILCCPRLLLPSVLPSTRVFSNESALCIRQTKYRSFKFSIVQHQFSSVQLLSHVSLRPHELQHARPPCPSPTPGVYPNPCPLSWWCHLTISSSVVPFSSCLQSFQWFVFCIHWEMITISLVNIHNHI